MLNLFFTRRPCLAVFTDSPAVSYQVVAELAPQKQHASGRLGVVSPRKEMWQLGAGEVAWDVSFVKILEGEAAKCQNIHVKLNSSRTCTLMRIKKNY